MVGRIMQASLGLVTALWGVSAALDLPPPSDIAAGALIAIGMAHVIFAAMTTLPARLRATAVRHPAASSLFHETADRIDALTNALGALVDQDIAYNDRDLVIRCSSHGEAMHKVFEARAVLAKVREQRG